ncbi:DNA replication/repair protein RecF [Kangiella sp. TOML190]|uniref:DNA replication/repair protein RecF n=1 Tax=Kangiella sp. TOML190 TaxID=2931351 RepID=UPI00203E28E3|nr:DNA replication/repair protein RecF [Kangiella sp. TOML190]
MQIQQLKIGQLRNIRSCQLELSQQLNIFYGSNGAGKSSLLEAIYTLGNGRSFRTARHAKVIQEGMDSFNVFAQFRTDQPHSQKIGLIRQRNGDIQIKLNGDKVTKLSNLSKTLPMQILAPEQYELLSKGPSGRRKLLDWGVFHVEHSFLSLWQKALKILQQRNQALKQVTRYQQLSPWDQQLIPVSLEIDTKRQEYIKAIEPIFQQLLAAFLPSITTELNLYSGWKSGESLEQVLLRQFALDVKTGFTHSSIQKADLKILVDGQAAADQLSRGQQKLVTIALKLAQVQLMQQLTKRCPIFLLDDIGAELDIDHQKVLLDFLAKQPKNQQIFITSVHLDPLKRLIKGYNRVKLFHVEHGVITEEKVA